MAVLARLAVLGLLLAASLAALAALAASLPLDAEEVSPGKLRRLHSRFSEELGLTVPEDELRWLLVTSKAMGVDIDSEDDVEGAGDGEDKQEDHDAARATPGGSNHPVVMPEVPGVPGSSIGMSMVRGLPGVPAVRIPAFPTKSVAEEADVDAIPVSGETSSPDAARTALAK